MEFTDLRVFQASYHAAMEIFEHSKTWPREERYSLTDQIRRSSRSVATCISEAWGRRRYERAFVDKLSQADTEAIETITWLMFARDCQYLPTRDFQGLEQDYRRVRGGLIKMMANPDPWCGPAQLVREPVASYDTEGADAEQETHPCTLLIEKDGRVYVIKNVPGRVDETTGEQLFAPTTLDHVHALIKGASHGTTEALVYDFTSGV